MGSDRPIPDERRSFQRAGVVGAAVVLARGRYVGTYLLENLSASGVLLVGDTRLAMGDRVRVLVQPESQGLALEARVVRHELRGEQSVFAVRFCDPSFAAQDAIQSMVLLQLKEGVPERVVLVVGADEGFPGLTVDLERLGRHPAVTRTALATIVWLESRGPVIEAIIVDSEWSDGVTGPSLLEFIAIDYPNVRRILLCASATGSHLRAMKAGHADAFLLKPWDNDSLRESLGQRQ
jgi:hypothetical protein